MDNMTYEDYISWANDYREQVAIIEKKLEKYKKKKRFATPKERTCFESDRRILNEMRRECLETALHLEHIAERIRKTEMRHTYRCVSDKNTDR